MKTTDSKFLEIKIDKKISVFIQAVKNTVEFDRPVFAINWFNTRWLWLYNIYNFLALRSVVKVQGKPFFKGLTQEVLHGEKEFRRDVLLIVEYPSSNAFKSMVESTYFQVVSLLRIAAVKSFGFGFFFPETTLNAPDKDDDSVYCFHHFSVADQTEIDRTLKQLKDIVNQSEFDVEPIFEGGLGAHLYSGNLKNKKQLPCLMDAAVVIKAKSNDALKQLIVQNDYQSLIQQTSHSFVAVVARVV